MPSRAASAGCPAARNGAGSLPGVTDRRGPSVADLDEDELIAAFLPLLPRGNRTLVPSGDDAALIAAPRSSFLVATDVLVQDQHFRLGWGSARDLGWRAAAQNLADIAAMGGTPTSLVVALVLPPATSVDWVLDLTHGFAEACEPHGVGVVGGDLSSGEQLVVAVTVHGELCGEAPVLRSGARAGHVLAHAGVLGRAAAGHDLLTALGPQGAPAGEPGERSVGGLVTAFLRPDPPLGSAAPAVASGVSAMLDVSDGLLRDAGRLARASGVVLDLESPTRTVPDDLAALAPATAALGLDAAAARVQREAWLLGGGEDHGLLATFPPDVPLPAGFRPLGTVRAPDETTVGSVLVDGRVPSYVTGWDHFAARGGTP